MEKKIVDGIIFRRYPNSKRGEHRKYFFSSSTKFNRHKAESLHRYIWKKYNGKIPKGYYIHHKDHNPLNNKISNLECLSPKEHSEKHYKEMLPLMQKNIRVAREFANKWHGSKEGIKFHKKLGKNNWKHWKLTTRNCNQCGKKYKTAFPSRSKFCHLNCKATALRRRRGIRGYYD